MGQIWASDYDLDVVGELFSREPVFGECKWWSEPVGINVLEKLEQNLQRSKLGANHPPRLLLFSRKGFTPALKKAARGREGLYLLEPRHLLARSRKAAELD